MVERRSRPCSLLFLMKAHSMALAQDGNFEFLLKRYKEATGPPDSSDSVFRAIGNEKITINGINALVAGDFLSGNCKNLNTSYFIDIFGERCTATIDLLSLYTKRAKTSSITADIKETADGAADLQRISEDRSTRKLRKRYGADLV